jgi:hypothetical protein
MVNGQWSNMIRIGIIILRRGATGNECNAIPAFVVCPIYSPSRKTHWPSIITASTRVETSNGIPDRTTKSASFPAARVPTFSNPKIFAAVELRPRRASSKFWLQQRIRMPLCRSHPDGDSNVPTEPHKPSGVSHPSRPRQPNRTNISEVALRGMNGYEYSSPVR